jgi:hypothetical protein
MSPAVAETAVRRLVGDAAPGERVNLAFLGGEPLLNRGLVREATELAARLAAERGVLIGFSITTNGTRLRDDDAEFFERYGFAVTISLDGVGAVHDRLRPTKGGGGSYARVIANAGPLLARQRRMQVSARVTVTPRNLDLREGLDTFAALGFHSVGFSPMLHAPSGRDALDGTDFALLAAMIDCGRGCGAPGARGRALSLREPHDRPPGDPVGTRRPYLRLGARASGSPRAAASLLPSLLTTGARHGDVQTGIDAPTTPGSERAVAPGAVPQLLGAYSAAAVTRSHPPRRPACDYIRIGWVLLATYADSPSAIRFRAARRDPTRYASADVAVIGGQQASDDWGRLARLGHVVVVDAARLRPRIGESLPPSDPSRDARLPARSHAKLTPFLPLHAIGDGRPVTIHEAWRATPASNDRARFDPAPAEAAARGRPRRRRHGRCGQWR